MTSEQATADQQIGMLVLKDRAGSYFLVSMETVERGRVPEEHKAAVEQLIAQADDVQGYLAVPVAIVAIELGILIGIGVSDATSGGGRGTGQAADIGRQAAAIGTMGRVLSNAGRPQ